MKWAHGNADENVIRLAGIDDHILVHHQKVVRVRGHQLHHHHRVFRIVEVVIEMKKRIDIDTGIRTRQKPENIIIVKGVVSEAAALVEPDAQNRNQRLTVTVC